MSSWENSSDGSVAGLCLMCIADKPRSLSILFAARNDSYTEDYLARLEFVVNFNARLINEYAPGSEIGIVISDYNSRSSLRESLRVHEDYSDLVKFIEYRSDEIGESGTSLPDFHVTKALNIGLRRVSSEYVLIMGTDHLFSPSGIMSLERVLKTREMLSTNVETYGLIPRRMLPSNFHPQCVSYHELKKYLMTINSSMFEFVNQKINTGAGIGGLLFSTDRFREQKGFSESWGGYGGSDSEFMSRVSIRHPHVDLSNVGVSLFKLPRTKRGSRVAALNKAKKASRPLGYFRPHQDLNDADWGEGTRFLQIKKALPMKASLCGEEEFHKSRPPAPFLTNYTWSQIGSLLYWISILRVTRNQKKLSDNEINTFCSIASVIERTNLKTLWFDFSLAEQFLPILVHLFKDVSVVIVDTPEDSGGSDFEKRCGRLIRVAHKAGHFGNILGKWVDRGVNRVDLNLDANQIFDRAVLCCYNSAAAKILLDQERSWESFLLVVLGEAPQTFSIPAFDSFGIGEARQFQIYRNENRRSAVQHVREFKVDKARKWLLKLALGWPRVVLAITGSLKTFLTFRSFLGSINAR